MSAWAIIFLIAAAMEGALAFSAYRASDKIDLIFSILFGLVFLAVGITELIRIR